MRQKFALMNPELTYTLPAYQTACGVADMFLLERYLPGKTMGLGDLCEAMRSIIEAPQAIADELRAGRILAGWNGGHNGLLGVGRSED